jgi:hypothetical protein
MNDPFKEQSYSPEDFNVVNKELNPEEIIDQVSREIKKVSKNTRDFNIVKNLVINDQQQRRAKILTRLQKKKVVDFKVII